MSRKNLFVGLWAGLAVGVVTALAFSGAPAVPQAMAQAQPQMPPAVQRYQMSAWAFPAGSLGANLGGSAASYGVYIFDTWSGKVWLVKEGNKPEALGEVKVPAPQVR